MTDTGEFVLRWTAWLSLLGWAASEWERARKGSTAGKRARLLFTLGGLALVAHAVAAFHVRYDWATLVAQFTHPLEPSA